MRPPAQLSLDPAPDGRVAYAGLSRSGCASSFLLFAAMLLIGYFNLIYLHLLAANNRAVLLSKQPLQDAVDNTLNNCRQIVFVANRRGLFGVIRSCWLIARASFNKTGCNFLLGSQRSLSSVSRSRKAGPVFPRG